MPPSPSEVETFHTDKIPFMILLNKRGREIGKMIENPLEKPTLEEELPKLFHKNPQ